MATERRTSILDLTIAPERPIITINKDPYELRTGDELTLEQLTKLQAWAPQFTSLKVDRLNRAEGKQLSQALKEACEIAVIAPATVLDALGDVQRVMILDVFTKLSLSNLGGLMAEARAQGAPTTTGTTSSRGSSGSTAATRRGGSRRPH